MTAGDEKALVHAASEGNRDAFDRLVAPHLPALRSYLLRLVAHPEDADDLAQDTAFRAYQKIDSFRGESAFRTWLFRIGTRLGLNHLKRLRRWPANVQSQMHDNVGRDPELRERLGVALAEPGLKFDLAEHIAYCFSCIGRSLPPIESAAVLLREVFDFKNREAAAILELTESAFRHKLAAARAHMIREYDGLCALINKQGVCHQCSELREACPPAARGPEVGPLGEASDDPDALLDRRLASVRRGSVPPTSAGRLHGEMLRMIAEHLH